MQTMSIAYQIILSTVPDKASATKLANKLVQEKIAACVNILPNLTSVYLWQGQIETTPEQLLIIKTREDKFHAVESCIKALHPYELPEIVAVPIERGLPEYLQWIDSCLSTN